jgi:hypothetical protein
MRVVCGGGGGGGGGGATQDVEKVPEELGGFPLFVKPEHGYDSTSPHRTAPHATAQHLYQIDRIDTELQLTWCWAGVGIDHNSVVSDTAAFVARVKKVCDEFGSALVEKFVDGREFSVLVAGSKGRVQVGPTPVLCCALALCAVRCVLCAGLCVVLCCVVCS